MSNLEQKLSQYAAYHLNHQNILTHFIGIPLIVFSILCLTARAGIDIGNFKVTLAMVLIAASTIYYLFLDKVFWLNHAHDIGGRVSTGKPNCRTFFRTMVGEFKHEVRQFQKPYDNQQAEQISLMV